MLIASCLAESASPSTAAPELLDRLQTSGKSVDSKITPSLPQANGGLQVSPLQPVSRLNKAASDVTTGDVSKMCTSLAENKRVRVQVVKGFLCDAERAWRP